jgi:multisubunit Na+/H+ antiporter MnhG subunit
VALVVSGVLALLAVLAIMRLPYARNLPLTRNQRWGLATVVALVFTLLSAWVAVVLPAYWD